MSHPIAELRRDSLFLCECTLPFQMSEGKTGIFFPHPRWQHRLCPPPDHVKDGTARFYSLRRFFEMAREGDPQAIGLLWTQENKQTIGKPDAMKPLLHKRHLFLSRRVYRRFAVPLHQLLKIHPDTEANSVRHSKPSPEEFCWFVDLRVFRDFEAAESLRRCGRLPATTHRVTDIGLDLSRYQVMPLEQAAGVYRLYDAGGQSKGVFGEENSLLCNPVPEEQAWKQFCGFLLYDEEAFIEAMSRWQRQHLRSDLAPHDLSFTLQMSLRQIVWAASILGETGRGFRCPDAGHLASQPWPQCRANLQQCLEAWQCRTLDSPWPEEPEAGALEDLYREVACACTKDVLSEDAQGSVTHEQSV